MTAERTGGGKLTELVPYHVLCYIHRNKLVSVVDSDRLTYEIRRDHTCTRPSFDDRLFVAFRLGDYFRFELGVDKRSFF